MFEDHFNIDINEYTAADTLYITNSQIMHPLEILIADITDLILFIEEIDIEFFKIIYILANETYKEQRRKLGKRISSRAKRLLYGHAVTLDD